MARHSSTCRLADTAGDRHARVVHQHVEFVDDFAAGFDGVGVGQIQRKGGGPEPVRDGVEPGGGPAAQQQGVRRGQRRGDSRADTAASAGDECSWHARQLTG